MTKRLLTLLLLAIFFQVEPGLASQDQVLEIKNPADEQVKVAGFILNSEKTIHIKAIGAGGKKKLKRFRSFQLDPNNLFAYAWILNAQTREMVWRMTIDNTKRLKWSEFNREFDGDITLPAGTYEVYFSAIEPMFLIPDGGFISFKQILERVLGSSSDWDKDSEKWMIRISGVDEVLSTKDVRKEQAAWLNKTAVHLINQKDDVFEKVGFTLKQPAQMLIYAIGEGALGKMYDYGWIVNANSHERVWKMEADASEYAGGAQKNKWVKTILKFKPGSYLVYYKTDDSHSAEEWNANPPYDPYFWGVVLKPVDANFDWKTISKYDEQAQNAIISITRVGDYAYREAFFRVREETKVRIFAIGEGRFGEMFDYGWISRAEDGTIVWKMNYDQTRHAGGSSKNRLFDGVITLEPGTYVVHYQTDDSHSYEEWNARPPQQPEMWGITIYNLGKKESVVKLDHLKVDTANILARLIQVGDDEFLRKDFYLTKESLIRIYCLGEGDNGNMYDYGWIKNLQTGEIVWRMEYNKTVSAGGASKNRMVDTIVSLPPGHYRVFYKSDGSHSYRHWNAAPPLDERNWGITVYLVEK